MEAVSRLRSLWFERFDACEIWIGQEFVAQGGQLHRKAFRIGDFQFAHDEELRAAVIADNDAAATFAAKKSRIAGFVDKAVNLVGHLTESDQLKHLAGEPKDLPFLIGYSIGVRMHHGVADFKVFSRPLCLSNF